MALPANSADAVADILEASTNLARWWPVMTNTATGAGVMELSGGIPFNDHARFYRVKFEQ